MKTLAPDVSIATGIGQVTHELRDYQASAVSSVLTKWQEFDRLLGVAATAAGKTHIFSTIVDLGLVQNRGHAAVLLTSLFAYLEHEPATQKQKRYCHFLGHPDPWQLTKREASRWIAQHKAQLTSIQERR
jgi:superfamily II DNA or RNA helicase